MVVVARRGASSASGRDASPPPMRAPWRRPQFPLTAGSLALCFDIVVNAWARQETRMARPTAPAATAAAAPAPVAAARPRERC